MSLFLEVRLADNYSANKRLMTASEGLIRELAFGNRCWSREKMR